MKDYTQLKKIANKMRTLTVEGVYHAQSGHPGGSLSICEMLTILFFKQMSVDTANAKDASRDRFVLSKGHAAPSYYAALALKGFFPEEEMKNLRNIDSFLQGHPCLNKVPGVDMSTGSLGQGLSAANGMAMMAKYDKADYRVYCICGDGEAQEGQIWEAAMTSTHYNLDNLTLFVDCNGLQIDGPVSEVMNNDSLAAKFKTFGWNVIEVANGHDLEALDAAVEAAKAHKGAPTAIVCKTVKGKGVSYMENQTGWHGAAPNKEQYELAMTELNSVEVA